MKGPKSLKIVIKLGTSSIVDENTHEPLIDILSLIVKAAVQLHKDGHKVIIVSSGAIGVGLRRMDVDKRPKHLPRIQALAAIGQCRLISLWDSLFGHLRQPIAQILLTRNDIADRTQYLNAQNTLNELLDMGVIPIVNENDTIAVSEIKFGDNDTLSAITAAMVHADYLFLMTDVDCLYDKNPRHNPDAKAIEVVDDIGTLQADVSSAGSSLGTGGMSTKIVAARLATAAGVMTVIARSSNPGNIVNIVRYIQSVQVVTPPQRTTSPHHGNPSQLNIPLHSIASSIQSIASIKSAISSPAELVYTPTTSQDEHPSNLPATGISTLTDEPVIAPLHTRFLPSQQPIRDRYFWLLHGLAPHGTVYIDEGAHRALTNKAGLLPVGVLDVEGNFSQQEAVRLVVVKRIQPPLSGDAPRSDKLWEGPGVEIGRALINYSSSELLRIRGLQSKQIALLLGYADSEYVAYRENISMSSISSRPPSPGTMERGTKQASSSEE